MSSPMFEMPRIADSTPASGYVKTRAKAGIASEHEATSMGDVVFPVRAPRGNPRMMVRTYLDGPSRKFEFKRPFVLNFEESDFGIVASHPNLACSGSGPTTKDAIDDFCEMFEVQWEALVECPIDELTPGAVQARECFLSLANALPME